MVRPSKFSFIDTTWIVVAMFFLFSVVGCSSSQKQTGPSRVSNWAYIPSSIVINPLSRIRTNEDPTKASVIVHIELQDGDGFSCRGVGELLITITSASGNNVDTKTYDLGDPKRNLELFDYVTRTYRIELLTGAEVPFVLVRASFDGGDSKTLRSKEKELINNSTSISN